MTITTQEERDAMKRLMSIMEGELPSPNSIDRSTAQKRTYSQEITAPGVVSEGEIAAMNDVINRLNSITDSVTEKLIIESHSKPDTAIALQTRVNNEGVKIGLYQIQIKEDETRLAGKQYYGIYHSATGEVIADNLSLYETAFNVVKLLNRGKYTNDYAIRTLFELDDSYTAHRIDAINFRRKVRVAEKSNNDDRASLFESRCQGSLERAMRAKQDLKALIKKL